LDTILAAGTKCAYQIAAGDKTGNLSDLSDQKIATTQEAPDVPTLHVQSVTISLSYRSAGANRFYWGTATVIIVDAEGHPVAGATVSGHWESATSDSDIGSTNTAGTLVLTSDEVRNPNQELYSPLWLTM
jgi:hypothetical protein